MIRLEHFALAALAVALVFSPGCGGCGCDSANLSAVLPENPDPPDPPDIDFDLKTYSQGGWGSTCPNPNSNNPGCYRDENFDTVYPSGVTIGCEPGFSALFTDSSAVEDFLPAGGTPAPFDQDYTDPTDTSAGVLAGQVLAATMNVDFDSAIPDFGPDDQPLGELVMINPESPCFGMTVQEIVDLGNEIIGGCSTALTFSEINECLTMVNENFVDCGTNQGNLGLPASPSLARAAEPVVPTPPYSQAEVELIFDLFDRLNQSRSGRRVTLNADLTAVAQAYALDMGDRGFFGHIDPSGLGPDDRLDSAGLPWNGFSQQIVGPTLVSDPTNLDEVMAYLTTTPGPMEQIQFQPFFEVGIGANLGSEGDDDLIVILFLRPVD